MGQGIRRTQAERRAASREALLEAAARGLSQSGYGNLVLEEVARDAGYSRGALYHQFEDKEDLALAVLAWVDESWGREVGDPAAAEDDPVDELLALARGHAIFCRRDVARVAMALRLEFTDADHPVAIALERTTRGGAKRIERLIKRARADGAIPDGEPAAPTARAILGALEGLVIGVGGRAPHDERLAAAAVAGLIGLDREDPRLGVHPAASRSSQR